MSNAAPTRLREIDAPSRRAATPGTFEILHEHIEVEPRVLMNPAAVAAHTQEPAYKGGRHGSVARLSNGLVVSRIETRDGNVGFRYAVYGENPDGVTFDEPRNWPEFFRMTLEKWDTGPGTHIIGPREHTDSQRFVADYPAVAARLGVEPEVIPKPIFAVGQARRPKNVTAHCNFRELVDRHASGDFGAVGVYSDQPLTAEQEWARGIQPVLIQNIHALRSGRGMVRSRFPFSVSSSHPYVCVVFTLLSAGTAATIVDTEVAQ